MQHRTGKKYSGMPLDNLIVAVGYNSKIMPQFSTKYRPIDT